LRYNIRKRRAAMAIYCDCPQDTPNCRHEMVRDIMEKKEKQERQYQGHP